MARSARPRTAARFAALALGCALALTPMAAQAYTDSEVIDGFKKTVFGSEYPGLFSTGSYVRKFNGTVRMHVSSFSPSLKAEVERFARSLNGLISGLRLRIVNDPERANFRVFVTTKANYETTVQRSVYGNRTAAVRGKCMVRSKFTRNGISRSDAVIVGDDSRSLFRRCMTEEILQGLGPLNDDPSLIHSMFNDRSRYTAFRRFDRLILNMLYDRRIENGMSVSQAAELLPRVLRDVRRNIRQR
ncbi:DUF2927 domain-containing protein [Pseudahrensia aquimaris]|uniref:DUF2927 domain-containing protein n=1 Tax=Pseudahrensia aquimaris TaxID=744461 RepID=A0ABW3FCG6_9HYPH